MTQFTRENTSMAKRISITRTLNTLPLAISGLVAVSLFLVTRHMLDVDPAIALTLDRHAPLMIGISAGLSALLMVYLAIAAVFHKNTRMQAIETLSVFTHLDLKCTYKVYHLNKSYGMLNHYYN